MSIPTSLIVVLLVVAWLVVLVPMVARRRERVPQAEPTGSGFRVLRRASATLRRRPGRGSKGRTVTKMDRPGETSGVDESLVTVGASSAVQEQPANAAEEWAAAQAAQQRRATAAHSESTADTLAEPSTDQPSADQYSADQYSADQYSADQDAADESRTDEYRADENGADENGADGSNPAGYVSVERDAPGSDVHDGLPDRYEPPVTIALGTSAAQAAPMAEAAAIPDEVDEQEWAEHAAAAPAAAAFAEVQDEQFRPIPRRPGRGGFDPEAAEATRAYRYQQRRRITLILLIATVAFSVTALLLVNWLWIGAAVSLVLLVGYLSYLRRQVRIEAAIRQKRMERLQRARQIRPEYARQPRRASRAGMSAVAPGRAVVDLDDDDPGFDDLEEYRSPVTYRRAAGQ